MKKLIFTLVLLSLSSAWAQDLTVECLIKENNVQIESISTQVEAEVYTSYVSPSISSDFRNFDMFTVLKNQPQDKMFFFIEGSAKLNQNGEPRIYLLALRNGFVGEGTELSFKDGVESLTIAPYKSGKNIFDFECSVK